MNDLDKPQEQSATEVALARAAEEWRSLFDAITDPVAILDKDLRLLRANQAAQSVSRDRQVVGRHCYEVFPCPMGPGPLCPALRTFRTGEVSSLKDELMRIGPRWFELWTYPIKDQNGGVRQVVYLTRDVTELKRAGDALKESEEKYRTLFETMAQGVVYQDAEGKIIEANPSALRILGLTLDQLIGRSSLYPNRRIILEDGSDFPVDTHPAVVALKTGRRIMDVIMGIFNPIENAFRWIKLSAVPLLRPGEDKPYRVYTSFDDITRIKQAENDLRSANRAKSAFLANISHELRTPLHAVIGLTDLALERTTEPELTRLLTDVKDSARKLHGLINELIDLSYLEASGTRLEQQPFDVKSVVESVLREKRAEVETKGLKLSAHLEPEVKVLAVGDHRRLRQALMLLVGNAVKFTEQGGISLTVDRESLDDKFLRLHFALADTGVGIPADRMASLFEGFTQADDSLNRRYGGLGLGLTIVKRLVDLMGGRIWVESAESQGSIFHLSIPVGLLDK
ncbi:MAG: ATP-binding protein [Thermodesulfobacteriota bacterium]